MEPWIYDANLKITEMKRICNDLRINSSHKCTECGTVLPSDDVRTRWKYIFVILKCVNILQCVHYFILGEEFITDFVYRKDLAILKSTEITFNEMFYSNYFSRCSLCNSFKWNDSIEILAEKAFKIFEQVFEYHLNFKNHLHYSKCHYGQRKFEYFHGPIYLDPERKILVHKECELILIRCVWTFFDSISKHERLTCQSDDTDSLLNSHNPDFSLLFQDFHEHSMFIQNFKDSVE